MNVDLALAGNFLNFRLCEIQLGAQCLLGEHGPLNSMLEQRQQSLEKLDLIMMHIDSTNSHILKQRVRE